MMRRAFVSGAFAYLLLAAGCALGLLETVTTHQATAADAKPPTSSAPGAAKSSAQPPAQAPPAGSPPAQAPSGPGPAPSPTGPAGVRPAGAAIDSFVAERDSLMNEVLKKITGRENAPAESVFKNIRVLKGVPAARLPRIMNMGFGRSLGTNCQHCHVPGHWADEDKPQKQVARDMIAMLHTINDSLLPKIKNLKSEKPTVTCTTCHRGQVKPATTL